MPYYNAMGATILVLLLKPCVGCVSKLDVQEGMAPPVEGTWAVEAHGDNTTRNAHVRPSVDIQIAGNRLVASGACLQLEAEVRTGKGGVFQLSEVNTATLACERTLEAEAELFEILRAAERYSLNTGRGRLRLETPEDHFIVMVKKGL